MTKIYLPLAPFPAVSAFLIFLSIPPSLPLLLPNETPLLMAFNSCLFIPQQLFFHSSLVQNFFIRNHFYPWHLHHSSPKPHFRWFKPPVDFLAYHPWLACIQKHWPDAPLQQALAQNTLLISMNAVSTWPILHLISRSDLPSGVTQLLYLNLSICSIYPQNNFLAFYSLLPAINALSSANLRLLIRSLQSDTSHVSWTNLVIERISLELLSVYLPIYLGLPESRWQLYGHSSLLI